MNAAAPRQKLVAGRQSFREQDYDRAEQLFIAALAAGADEVECRRHLARIYNSRRQWAKALEEWTWLHKRNRTAVEPQLQVARAHVRLEHHEAATAAFEAVLSLAPENAEAQRAIAQLRRVQLQQAVTLAERGNRETALGPKVPILRRLYRQVRGAVTGHPPVDRAEQLFIEAIAKGADEAECRLQLARIYNSRRQWDKALEEWTWLHERDRMAVEPQLQVARAQVWLGRHAEAAAGFEAVLRLAPEHAEASAALPRQLLLTGRRCYRDRDLDRAEQVFVQAIAAGADEVECRLHLARIYNTRQQWEKALEAWTWLHERNRTAVEPLLQVARAHVRLDHHEAAMAAFEAVLSLAPENAEAQRDIVELERVRLQHAVTLMERGDRETALGILEEALRNDPQSPDASGAEVAIPHRLSQFRGALRGRHPVVKAAALRLMLVAGRQSFREQDFDRAEQLFIDAIAKGADEAECRLHLARIYNSRQQWEKALEQWIWLHERDRTAVEPLLQVARVHVRLQHHEAAKAAFEAVLSLAPENKEAQRAIVQLRRVRMQHAVTLAERGDRETALGIVEETLRDDPGSPDAIGAKVAVLHRLGDRAALEDYARDLGTRPWTAADSALLERIGSSFADVKSFETATQWLERAHTLDPTNISALRLLARISYNEQRYDLADRLCVELEQVGDDRGKIEAALFRARIAHYRGNPSDAAEHYERVIGLAPDHAEAVTFLVRYYLGQRQIEKAEARVAAARRPGNESRDLLWGALIDRARGRIEEASDALLTGLDSFGDDDQYCQHAAEFMMEVGSFDKAEHILLRGLAAAPTSLRLAGRLLQCRMRGDCPPEEIVELCTRTLDLHGANEEALLQRGSALSRLGRRREAIADFRTGLNAFPRNLTFWRSAISSLLLLGEEASARALLNEAAAVFARRTTEDLCALAEIFDAADLMSEALACAEAALAIDPHSETVRRLTARIQVQLGRFDSAWPLLQSPQAAGHRPIRTVRLYAQVAAGRWALEQLNGGAETGAERIFPDRLFDAVVQRAGIRSAATGGRAAGLRILHVTSTLGSGGAERQLASTVAGLARLRNSGIEVELAAEDLNPAHGRDFFLPPIRETGAPVYSLADEGRKGTWRDMLARRPETRIWVQAIAAMPAEVTRNALNLLPILLERRPDVVHLWQDSVCIASGIAAVMAGIPRIILATRSTRPIERQRARRYIEPGFRALLRCPGVSLISNSRNGARDYEDWLGLPADSLGVIHNGYDFASITGRIDDERSQAIRREVGIPPEAPVLGGVMRCSFEKRPELWTETAIATVGALPQAHAILVGTGPMLEQIRSRVAECGLTKRIHFAGMQQPVEPWMRAMNVLFLSSLTEGLPNVLIEAQALGVPVATMRVGGAPETMREDETGIVIDEGAIDAIAGPIVRLLKDPARRHTFGKNAMAWAASEFSIEAAVEHMLALYRGQQGAAPGRGRRSTEPASAGLALPG